MDDTDEISEIISSCKDYNSQLSKCMHSLDESLNVIYSSAEESSKIINKYFGDLLESVTALIKENEEEMLAKIDSLKSNVVQPLTQSMKLVQQKLMNSENILEECKAIKETKLDKVSYNLKLAALDRMTVSVGSLPEVPALHNMPVLTVSMNHSCSNDIKKQLKNVGEIICACPVQFTNWKELPGSISLHWQEMNEEELEDPKFCIRYCRGNMKKRNSSTGSFTMVYPGSDDSSLIIRNLELGAFYSFQVAYSNETMARNKIFSNIIWSYPLVLSTSLPHYQFSGNLSTYNILCNGRNAHKSEDTIAIHNSLLMSNQPVSIPLHSIMFKILEVGEIASPDVEGIGLMQKSNKCWQKEGSVVLNVNGIIAVDGKQMVTQLPELSKGDIIIFTCEYLGPCQRLRVYIESQEKQITFDWKLSSQFLSKPSIENQNMSPFNLALCFFNKGWNISVQ